MYFICICFRIFLICRTVRYEDTVSWRWLWMYVHTCLLCILRIISIFFIFRILWFLDAKSDVCFSFNLHLYFELPFFVFFSFLLFLLFIWFLLLFLLLCLLLFYYFLVFYTIHWALFILFFLSYSFVLFYFKMFQDMMLKTMKENMVLILVGIKIIIIAI